MELQAAFVPDRETRTVPEMADSQFAENQPEASGEELLAMEGRRSKRAFRWGSGRSVTDREFPGQREENPNRSLLRLRCENRNHLGGKTRDRDRLIGK